MPLPSALNPPIANTARLRDAILSLQPTAYWPMDDGSGPLRDLVGNRYPATVTGSPTYGVAAPSPIGRGVTWSGSERAISGTGIAQVSAAVTLISLFCTTDASATNRTLIGRSASYWLRINTGHGVTMSALQATTAGHCSINAGTGNTGNWTLAVGTFDGTTARVYVSVNGGAISSNSSTTLTGSWGKASAAGVSIAAIDGASPMIGTTAHSAVILERVLTAAEVRWLASIAFGG